MVAYCRLLDERSDDDFGVGVGSDDVVDNGRARQVLPPRNLDTLGRNRLAALGASCGRLMFILIRVSVKFVFYSGSEFLVDISIEGAIR